MFNLLAVTIDLKQEATSQNLPGSKNANAADAGFGAWIGNIMSAALFIGAILVLFYLIWGGIEWITSGGDKGKLEAARNKITSAILGIIVMGASVAIIMLVQRFLGVCFLKFAGGTC